MKFTDLIESTMREKGITAYKICKDLNISQTTYSGWKTGRQPALDKAIEIIRYLEISADELFELKSCKTITLNPRPALTAEEEALLEKYNQLTERNKGKAEEKIESLIEEQTKNNDNIQHGRLYG